jgi:GTP-binding nuclear protein Ran
MTETNTKSNGLDNLICEESVHQMKNEQAIIMCSQSECNKKIICALCAINNHVGHTMSRLDDISHSIREEIVEELKILEGGTISISEKINKLENKLAEMYTLKENNIAKVNDKKLLLEQENFLDENRALPPNFNKFLTVNLTNTVTKTDQCIPDKKIQCDSVTYNLLLVGERGVGKTSLIKRCIYGDFETSYTPTTIKEAHTLNTLTNGVYIKYNVYESTFDDFYPKNIDCAIIMIDNSKIRSFDYGVSRCEQALKLHYGQIPIVICGNKINPDMQSNNNSYIQDVARFYKKMNKDYFVIDTKTHHNLEAPFRILVRKLRPDLFI